MKMYITGGYRNDITEIEVTRKTEKSIWYMHEWAGRSEERQCRRMSNYDNHFDTWVEAHKFLLDKLTKKANRTKVVAESASEELKKVESMSEEQR